MVAEKETIFLFQERVNCVEARTKAEEKGLGRKELQAEGMTKQRETSPGE